MIRTFSALTALAMTAALALPAAAATMPDRVVVKLAGKTVASAFSDITIAAKTVCQGIQVDNTSGLYAGYDCVKDTVSDTIAGIGSPALSKYAASYEARLQLASN